MDFDLTKEQEMIRKEVRKFATAEIAPIAGELDEEEQFSEDLTRKMGEIGLFGMFVPEAFDGQEMDYLSYIIAVEEIARIDGSQAATIGRPRWRSPPTVASTSPTGSTERASRTFFGWCRRGIEATSTTSIRFPEPCASSGQIGFECLSDPPARVMSAP